LAKIFPSFKFGWLAEETKLNLPIELDFLNEAKNIEKIKMIFKNYKFIKVIKKFLSRKSRDRFSPFVSRHFLSCTNVASNENATFENDGCQ
jgi:hypothetical protein